ncbi:hypothetical protein GLYMA_15G226051v4 [Glycine max]|nr:hypothetical protein GLYMA_15G226051v4 [Glycine max]KAH1148451.1 hypothetical protein GYH30_043190 [Glycine max]
MKKWRQLFFFFLNFPFSHLPLYETIVMLPETQLTSGSNS